MKGLTSGFVTSLLMGAIVADIPLLLAGLGEQLSEKAGVLNIGLEGMMLAGAWLGFLVAWRHDSMAMGLWAGAAGGMVAAALMADLCLWLRLNQIVIGIALTLGAEGATALLQQMAFSHSYPRLGGVDTLSVPWLANLSVFGKALFVQPLVVYLAVGCVPLLAWLYRASNAGLALQTAGDKPGALAGLGGAYMAQIGAGIFVPFMTQGNGFIAIVLAMLARGRPLWVLAGALLFGTCLSLTTALQVLGVNLPTDVIQMLPFITVMLVLVVFGRRAVLPAALGTLWTRGAR
ncbi:ABC transporter, permease protein [Candidatus Sodalis pierantonius str. SOPE]|uniref:ABC transporter, permease protein n=1 Tax=Candidatus Sodalis pierantonii str. SOPE TaxID=2342 RepID=W0HQS9_9GAMM|nr:ABC transporter permease [Candidatus Sodalis pierantonius]AHF74458.1 ABC transporter, permease protein [Candidatus Sodalis pierantonius str. SOPE]